jgi:ATP-dependent Clp protease protease subunit
MLHQPWGGVTGQAEDIRIQAEEIVKAKKVIIDLLSKHTGLTPEKIAEETERDKYMTAEEAKAYGLIDEVLEEPQDTKKKKEKTEKK